MRNLECGEKVKTTVCENFVVSTECRECDFCKKVIELAKLPTTSIMAVHNKIRNNEPALTNRDELILELATYYPASMVDKAIKKIGGRQ